MVALVVAVRLRQVVPALAVGSLCGTGLLAAERVGWVLAAPVGAVDLVRVGLLGRVSEPANAQMLVLVALISAFVHLLDRSGSARALVAGLARGVRTPTQALLATWTGGLVLFFSDLGNLLILGPMFRPLYDRLGLPREQLAWVIDTTAAPVCVLVPFIAWGVYAAGLVEAAQPGQDGFVVLAAALPHQLYPWLSLLFVPAMAIAGRPFGPMTTAVPVPPEAKERADEVGGGPAALALGVLLVTLVAVGGALAWSAGQLTGDGVRLSLASAYLAATLALGWRLQSRPADVWQGMGRAAPLAAMLVLAWTLGEVCAQLGTGTFLAAALGPSLPAAALPVTVFALGGLMSFSMGTSWGTFAILIPIGISLAVEAGAPVPLVVGAALSGGVFGDHCSPISDTTLLASVAAETDHGRHVATQLPYALAIGACAALGFAAAGALGGLWGLGVGGAGVIGVVVASRLGPLPA